MQAADLRHEGERIAVIALEAADKITARYRMPPQAQCDLLEVIRDVIDAHRDRLIEVHEIGLDEVDD